MLFERLSSLASSWRFRLGLWNAGVVLITALAILLGVREGSRFALTHEMDDNLVDDLGEVALTVETLPVNDATLREHFHLKAITHKHHSWFLIVSDAEGREVWASETAPAERPPLQKVDDITPASVGSLRVVHQHATSKVGRKLVLQVGSNYDFVDAELARIERILYFAALIALIIAPLGGFWLADRAIAPLSEIIAQTDDIHPRQLQVAALQGDKTDEAPLGRLPLRGTGDELDQLSQTINSLLERIGTYIGESRTLLANAAHELRTPLAAIHSTVEVALGTHRTREEYQELLAVILQECSFLEVLVNQLLLLSEADAGRLMPTGEAVALDKIIAAAADMFQAVAEVRGIELRVHPLPSTSVHGQRIHLRQLVSNLLDNAIKYTPDGGRVEVLLTGDEDVIELQISDTGIGISAEDLPHVFERFFRGEKSRRRDLDTRGTGLGLSICQMVVQAHGGQIRVESKPGRGSKFIVVLPRSDALSASHPTMVEAKES